MPNMSLDRRVAISRRSSTLNDFNEPVDSWSTLATVWASVVPISDGERLRAGETLAQKSSRFTIRWSATVDGVDPRDRIVFDGSTYDIQGVKKLGRKQFLEITATARAETA